MITSARPALCPFEGILCVLAGWTRASTVTWSPSRSEDRSVSSPRV